MEVMNRQMHIALRQGDVGGYCLLPGDPERCQHIASYLEGAEFVARNREFVTYTGTLPGSGCRYVPPVSAAPVRPLP